MDRDRRLSLTVGGFALAALAALVVAILSLSAQQGIFRARYRLVAYFDNVQGLVSGAAVRLAGTQVGQVESVDLSLRPGGEPAVKVMLQVDEEVQQRIRANSVAVITIKHFVAQGLPIDDGEALWPQLWVFIGSGYVFKMTVALLYTIPFYLGVGFLALYLEIDPTLEH